MSTKSLLGIKAGIIVKPEPRTFFDRKNQNSEPESEPFFMSLRTEPSNRSLSYSKFHISDLIE